MLLGALEAGGTKMVCALGDENGNVLERESFPTRMPEDTMPALIDYFQGKGIKALGIGSFGPLNLDPADPHFGDITTTPKPGWINYPLRKTLADALGVPVGIDTDVNAAALGEAHPGTFAVAYCKIVPFSRILRQLELNVRVFGDNRNNRRLHGREGEAPVAGVESLRGGRERLHAALAAWLE